MNYMHRSKVEELIGNFAGSLLCLDKARRTHASNPLLHDLYEAALTRLCERIDGTAMFFKLEVEPVHESDARPEQYDFEHETSGGEDPRPIVALTAISSRLARIESTIDSILAQSRPAHSINLFVSEERYRVDDGVDLGDEMLRRLADKGINIYNCANIGPYRKQYPLISMLHSIDGHPEIPIITMDDDVIYPSDTLEKLVTGLRQTDCVTAFRGRAITVSEQGIRPYNEFTEPRQPVSHFNLGTGKNGIAYKLKFFPRSPSLFVGPLVAPTADDIWCKWVTGVYCIPTHILVPEAAFNPELDFTETDPEDKLGLFHRYNARGSNDEAIRGLELYFSRVLFGLFPILRDFADE